MFYYLLLYIMTESAVTQPMTPTEWAESLRTTLKGNARSVKTFADFLKSYEPATSTPDKWEMISNAILSYRHMEDAIMRLGKVIQAYEWGVSVYDKAPGQSQPTPGQTIQSL